MPKLVGQTETVAVAAVHPRPAATTATPTLMTTAARPRPSSAARLIAPGSRKFATDDISMFGFVCVHGAALDRSWHKRILL